MHYCPDCGEECGCKGDLGEEIHCEHVCATPEEKEYRDDIANGLFDKEFFEDYDED